MKCSNIEPDWDLLMWIEDLERYEICPACKNLSLDKPPLDPYWQVSCHRRECGLIVSCLPVDPDDFLGEAMTTYWIGDCYMETEEKFKRFLKLRSFE